MVFWTKAWVESTEGVGDCFGENRSHPGSLGGEGYNGEVKLLIGKAREANLSDADVIPIPASLPHGFRSYS